MRTRRDFLRQSGMATAAAWLTRGRLLGQEQPATAQSAANPPAAANTNPAVQSDPDLIQELRAAASAETIKTTKLTDTIFLMQGVGGNIVCQIGPDGKLVIDSGIDTGSHHLLDALEKLDTHRLKLLMNTNWHFENTSGNAELHLNGALILAQDNTRVRLSQPQYMQIYDVHFPSASDAALPQETFPETETLWMNNDQTDLVHTPDAQTDSDIFVHFNKGNVIHAGGLWFNGMYPLIDLSSGGTINGMIRGVDQVLALADDHTQIVPGYGTAGGKTELQAYREMLVTVADRVEKLKASGDTVQQAIAARPTAELDAAWGKGKIQPNTFVALVYDSL
jgi:glyoxylase-like metal-dependent hydrolase (beta-lactamase superfamily II)